MKPILLRIAVAAMFAVSVGAWAGEKPKDSQPKKPKIKKSVPPKKERDVALTGSYIKRDVYRNGMITDGQSPVLVIDQSTVRNSGASDLRQLLMRQGANH